MRDEPTVSTTDDTPLADGDFLQAPYPDAVDVPDEERNGPGRFFNRELSWLAFNWRVLDEAAYERVPLLERCFFN